MSKVGITGKSGFIGTNLSSYLITMGYEIVNIDLRNKFWDRKSLNSLDCIIHLAGKAHDNSNKIDPNTYYDINQKLTENLFTDFLNSKSKKFIFVSSVKAVKDHADVPLQEDELPNPETHYGKSKMLAEKFIISHKNSENKIFYILRPCMVHGPGNKGNLNLLYNFIRRRFPYPFGSFNNRRSFICIDNFCFLVEQLIKKNIQSGVYHIADDQYLSTNDIINLIKKGLNIKYYFTIRLNKSLILALIKFFERAKFFNTKPFHKLTENFVVSNNKIKKHLGIESLPYTSQEGISKTILSFKHRK